MERTIWTYWEDPPGKSEPPHISLCRKLLIQNCPSCTINLVTPANVRAYLPDLPEKVNGVAFISWPSVPMLAIKCDFIRAFLLERYGGVYIDSDAVVVQDLAPVFDLFERWEFVGTRRTSAVQRHVPVNFYGARAGGEIISAYAGKLRGMLNRRTAFAWHEAGAAALTPVVNRRPDSSFLFEELRIIPVLDNNVFLSREIALEKFLAFDPLMFMLFHTLFRGDLGKWSERQLLGADILLSKIFRYASGGRADVAFQRDTR